jgi:hypothetical protein
MVREELVGQGSEFHSRRTTGFGGAEDVGHDGDRYHVKW